MLLQNEITFVESKMLELSQKHDLQKYANSFKLGYFACRMRCKLHLFFI